ncbi:hypothetical protein VPNG_07095 [Cytospora leucostoma]|uniref:Ecp2 effector protein domain-containing protein n=1 Tax=Cytospora leucostoma TaxID=1230097 RepID=A0A423WVK8_9PEZI|nr:hypothetical protein VPNG_07095 [Cytospora leucostoma]
MQFKIATITAAMPFIGTALGHCYKGGMKWSDIGTTDDINKALDGICDILWDKYYVGETARDSEAKTQLETSQMWRCLHVNDHGLHFSWRVDQVPKSQDYAWISKDECVDIGQRAVAQCGEHGGDDLDIFSGPTGDGGDYVEVNVRADPQWATYEC